MADLQAQGATQVFLNVQPSGRVELFAPVGANEMRIGLDTDFRPEFKQTYLLDLPAFVEAAGSGRQTLTAVEVEGPRAKSARGELLEPDEPIRVLRLGGKEIGVQKFSPVMEHPNLNAPQFTVPFDQRSVGRLSEPPIGPYSVEVVVAPDWDPIMQEERNYVYLRQPPRTDPHTDRYNPNSLDYYFTIGQVGGPAAHKSRADRPVVSPRFSSRIFGKGVNADVLGACTLSFSDVGESYNPTTFCYEPGLNPSLPSGRRVRPLTGYTRQIGEGFSPGLAKRTQSSAYQRSIAERQGRPEGDFALVNQALAEPFRQEVRRTRNNEDSSLVGALSRVGDIVKTEVVITRTAQGDEIRGRSNDLERVAYRFYSPEPDSRFSELEEFQIEVSGALLQEAITKLGCRKKPDAIVSGLTCQMRYDDATKRLVVTDRLGYNFVQIPVSQVVGDEFTYLDAVFEALPQAVVRVDRPDLVQATKTALRPKFKGFKAVNLEVAGMGTQLCGHPAPADGNEEEYCIPLPVDRVGSQGGGETVVGKQALGQVPGFVLGAEVERYGAGRPCELFLYNNQVSEVVCPVEGRDENREWEVQGTEHLVIEPYREPPTRGRSRKKSQPTSG